MLKAEKKLIVCKGWSFPIYILKNIIVFVTKKKYWWKREIAKSLKLSMLEVDYFRYRMREVNFFQEIMQ